MKLKKLIISSIVGFSLILTGCNNSQFPTPTEINSETPSEISSIDTIEPVKPTEVLTPTPSLPAVASINGVSILKSDFEDELKRYLTATSNLGQETNEEQAKEIVLSSMEETVILAIGAHDSGYVLDDNTFEEKLTQLIADSGGEDQFNYWLSSNFYSQESFQRLYRLELEATWMRDQIISQVPTSEEQIRARQILVSGESLADDIYSRLQNGADFDYFAWGYDLLSGGELGWFPRDYLVLPQIEEAVFALQPGEYTSVIESTYGYHIVQVMERELDRPLTQDALIQKQKNALRFWLDDKLAESTIVLN